MSRRGPPPGDRVRLYVSREISLMLSELLERNPQLSAGDLLRESLRCTHRTVMERRKRLDAIIDRLLRGVFG